MREQLECIELCLEMDEVRQAEAKMELNLARNAKDNAKGFYMYIGEKRKTRKKCGPFA